MKKDFDKFRTIFFVSLLIGVTLLLIWIIRPFMYPIFWAAVLAWLFYPLYRNIHKHFIHHKGGASFVTITLVIMIFLLPFIAVSSLIVQQSFTLYRASEQEVSHFYDQSKNLLANFGDLSVIQLLEDNGIDLRGKIIEVLRSATSNLAGAITSITSGTVKVIIGFFIMLYALYYFFQDGEMMMKKILRLSPLDDVSEKAIYEKFTSTIRATIKGSLLVSLIQGLFAAVVFWIAGVVAPFFWGVVMVALAILPVVGPGLLAFPTGIILLISGKIWQGIFVLFFGVVVVSIIDNLLRPYLVGRDVEIHPLIIFFSTIGGLVVFGAPGFIIGPVCASIFVSLWHMYEKQYKRQLDKN